MVNYLDSRRIMGTTAERSSIPITATAGGWVELGRSSGAQQLDVSSLANKRYYMILTHKPSGNAGMGNYLNGDTGSNYASRYSSAGGADTTGTGQTVLFGAGIYFGNYNEFMVSYIANYSSKEKLAMMHLVGGNTTGAGNAPDRFEDVSKWANTSNAINRIQTQGTMTDANSEMVVLGWDSSDTHTTNFWEELADVTLSSAGDDLSSGTITAKKYLWVQAWYKNDGASDINALVRFNGDTGTNYSSRYSANGGADVTRTNRTWIDIESGNQRAKFVNMFIINNQSNEKLVIFNQMDYGSSGAGNAPNRWEGVGKWTNTSNQITEINFKQLDAGDYASGAFIKVWGSD